MANEKAERGNTLIDKSHQEDWSLTFLGRGGELFRIFLVNFWLKILTLGIDHPWAKARVLCYLYASTRLHDTDFQFHGNGRELFIGWFKALLALFLLEGLHQVLVMELRRLHFREFPLETWDPSLLFWLETINFMVYFFLFFMLFMIALVGVRRLPVEPHLMAGQPLSFPWQPG